MSAPEIPRVVAADLPGAERASSEQSHCLITSVPPCEQGCPYRSGCPAPCVPFSQWTDKETPKPPPRTEIHAGIPEIVEECKSLRISLKKLEIAAGFPEKFLSRNRESAHNHVAEFSAALEFLKFHH